MKKITMLCCLVALLCSLSFAADKKPFDQTVTPQALLDAKDAALLRLQHLESSQAPRERGALDECPDVTINAPAVYQGNTCETGNDCLDLGSEELVVAVNIPHAGVWSFYYEGFGYDPYMLIGYECCTWDICLSDDSPGSLNSLCPCVFLNEGTVYVSLEAFSGCGGFVLTVSEGECNVGRCCYTDAFGGNACATTLQEDCIELTGVWDEGLNCQENPCTFGRCCYFDDGEAACMTTGAALCLYQLGGEWTEGLTCEEACPAPGDCGPIDLVFAVDISGSMQGAINNVVAEMPNIIAVANIASGNDLRLGLVTFTGDEFGEDYVHTEHNLTLNLAAVQASIAALVASAGDGIAESSDEALREIITNDAGCTDGTEFTSAFRPAASKIIVLITDATPGGCDDIHDASDDVNAHQRALDAAAAGIRISSVYVPNPFGETPAQVLPNLNDYALTSAGSVRIAASNGAGTGGAINQILRDCGQGELQLFPHAPDLRCDPNGGGITTPIVDIDVDVHNDGTADCQNVMLEITNIGGDGGAIVINSSNPVALGNIAQGATVPSGFNITITPDDDGGTIILTVNVTSDNCPPNFVQVVIDVPDCTPCDGESSIYIYEDDDRIPPACLCTYLCQGTPLDVFVCGAGLTPGHYPILTITPGCRTEDCNEDCTPAEFLFSNTGWTLWGDSCWHNLIIPQSDGCICICFDRYLPVELNGFTAVGRDGEVQVNWTTASETNNDHFELMRDGVMAGNIEATNNSSGSSYIFVDRGLTNGRSYHYELVSVSVNGERAVAGELNAVPQAGSAVVTELALHQNYPNPFNPETNITFDLVETGMVTLKVYNAVGQEVAALVNGSMSEGRHTVEFKATGLPSGLYFYRLTAGESTMQKKMLLLK